MVRFRWISRLILLVVFIFLVTAVGIGAFTLMRYSPDLVSKDRIVNRTQKGLLVLDRHGVPFFTFNQSRPESAILMTEIPIWVKVAVISSEDKDFYHNPGFSLRGIARAFWENIKAGKLVQGGSTISQGLVKNTFLNPKRTLFRKYQEIILALALNQRFSKDDILEMYLNTSYFGEGAYGIEAAAHTFFNTHAKDLTLPQAALLVGLLPSPSSHSPLSHDPSLALERQRVVLAHMLQDGYINKSQFDTASATKLAFESTPDTLNNTGVHFALYVRDLIAQKYGEETITTGGYTVKTTLDLDWQRASEDVLKDQVIRLHHNRATNGAVVVIDPNNGEVLAMVGSMDWNNNQFGKINMALSPRQPGSAFKPIIYADALERRIITPATLLNDKPQVYERDYRPQNYDKKFRGKVTVRRALANSLNVPAIEVMNMEGVSRALAIASQFGITTLGQDSRNYGLSLILGAGNVPLLELTSAYGVFANQGYLHKPDPILEIKDKYDHIIHRAAAAPRQVISAETAFLVSSILADTKSRQEVFGNALTINRPAAVKTGTTSNYRDALTIGYTPDIVIGVWIGNTDNTPMDSVAGSLGAAPIWKTLMNQFLGGAPKTTFLASGSITQERVCPYQQLTSNPASRSAYLEYFIAGTETPYSCSQHRDNSPHFSMDEHLDIEKLLDDLGNRENFD